MEQLRFILAAVLTCAGLFVLVTAVLGLFRFRYSLNRIHASSLADTLGILLMLTGLMLAFGADTAVLKLLAVIAFLWLTSPVSSHLIGRLEVTVNDDLDRYMKVDDPEAVRREKEGDA